MSFNSKYTGAQVEAWLDNIKNYSANDILTKLKTVDGSGSGLDADTLDGLDSSMFGQFIAKGEIPLGGIREGFRAGKLFGASGAATEESAYRGILEYGASGYIAQFNSGINSLYYRWCEGGSWGAWKTIAFTDSNVASATKATQDNDGRAISSTYFRYRGELYGSALSQTVCGFWTTYDFSQDLPSTANTKYGILAVFAASASFKSALWLNNSGELYMYTVVDSSKTGWVKVK
jgi:hypothetical protein